AAPARLPLRRSAEEMVMFRFDGALPYFNDAVGDTKQTLKDGPGMLYMLRLVNTTGQTAYLQFFDKLADDVTVGTTAHDWAIRLGANESYEMPPSLPLQFFKGLVLAGTTTATGATGAAISVS